MTHWRRMSMGQRATLTFLGRQTFGTHRTQRSSSCVWRWWGSPIGPKPQNSAAVEFIAAQERCASDVADQLRTVHHDRTGAEPFKCRRRAHAGADQASEL